MSKLLDIVNLFVEAKREKDRFLCNPSTPDEKVLMALSVKEWVWALGLSLLQLGFTRYNPNCIPTFTP